MILVLNRFMIRWTRVEAYLLNDAFYAPVNLFTLGRNRPYNRGECPM